LSRTEDKLLKKGFSRCSDISETDILTELTVRTTTPKSQSTTFTVTPGVLRILIRTQIVLTEQSAANKAFF